MFAFCGRIACAQASTAVTAIHLDDVMTTGALGGLRTVAVAVLAGFLSGSQAVASGGQATEQTDR